jgi:hypothetical protein
MEKEKDILLTPEQLEEYTKFVRLSRITGYMPDSLLDIMEQLHIFYVTEKMKQIMERWTHGEKVDFKIRSIIKGETNEDN